MYTNDTNFVSSGLGAGGYGGFGGFGGSGFLSGIILAALFGRRGFGDGFGGGDCDHSKLIVDAINGKIDAVKEIASHLHTDIDNVQMALCDAKAKLEANGVKIDCVKDSVHNLHADFRGFQREFCDFKADQRVALKDLEIRALTDKADVLKKIECVEDQVAKEFCQLRTEFKDQRISELEKELCRAERNYEKKDTEISNINFGTQLTTLTQTITALASKVGA